MSEANTVSRVGAIPHRRKGSLGHVWAVGLQWGFAAEEESVDLHGTVRDAAGTAVTHLRVRCTDSQQKIVRALFPNENGEFTLRSIPKSVETITCVVGPDHRGKYEDSPAESIPVEPGNSFAFILDFLPVKKLEARIIPPKGWKLENAWIEVTQNGKTFSFFAEDGKFNVETENLKLITGPARVTYRAAGVSPRKNVETELTAETTLATSLPFDPFPYGLLLLIPAIVILGLRAGLEWRWRQRKRDFRDLGLLLIIIAVVLWGGTFFALWWLVGDEGANTLHVFHPNLSFSLAVPIFGFLGSLLFVIDVFQSRTPTDLSSDQIEKQNLNTSMEFVLRLVLGPYVAIVMVLLFRDTFTFLNVSDHLGAQATVAFFSGFLVTLVLQSLSEKGNELIGEWRSTTRYDPSEIARELNLAMEEDLKLRKVNLKYLGHLRRLTDDDIVHLAKQSDINEGLLFSLRDEARARRMHDVPLLVKRLEERIGTEVWGKLQQEGIKSVWDLAARTPEEIRQIAPKHNIDPEILTKHSDDAKALVKTPWF
jgi:hypothetical protein